MSIVSSLRELTKQERLGAVVTVVSGPDVGMKAVLDAEDGLIAGELPDEVSADVLADAQQLMEHEQNRTLSYGERQLSIAPVPPPPLLLIFGAGHVAQPLSRMAQELGFRVIVSDARKTWATEERFPNVDQLIAEWPDKAFEQVEPDRRTYVVLLSHDARFEDPVFPAVRNKPIRYLGGHGQPANLP